jgi:hypothetical protein
MPARPQWYEGAKSSPTTPPEKAARPKLTQEEIKALLEVSAVAGGHGRHGEKKKWGTPLALSAPGLALLTLGWGWLPLWGNAALALVWVLWVIYVFRQRTSAPGW